MADQPLYVTCTIGVPGTDGYYRRGDVLPPEAVQALSEPVYQDGEAQDFTHLDVLRESGAISTDQPEDAEPERSDVQASDQATAADVRS